MSSEEDDYMSDAFLAKLDDKRPGLITGKKAEKLMREEKIRFKVLQKRTKSRLRLDKVGCVFSMVILSEFRMGQ